MFIHNASTFKYVGMFVKQSNYQQIYRLINIYVCKMFVLTQTYIRTWEITVIYKGSFVSFHRLAFWFSVCMTMDMSLFHSNTRKPKERSIRAIEHLTDCFWANKFIQIYKFIITNKHTIIIDILSKLNANICMY